MHGITVCYTGGRGGKAPREREREGERGREREREGERESIELTDLETEQRS
jgi:hypothetical protein